MNQEETERHIQLIDELIEALKESPETHRRTAELVQLLMELHGVCVARLIDIVSRYGFAGQEILKAFSKDELVSGLLMLYDVHPLTLEQRVADALETVRASLKDRGREVTLASIDDGVVRLKLSGAEPGCESISAGLKREIEELILGAAPDLNGLIVEEANVEAQPVLMPLQGQSRAAAS